MITQCNVFGFWLKLVLSILFKLLKNDISIHSIFETNFSTPKNHMTPTKPTYYTIISLFVFYTFSVCRSMHNLQWLYEYDGVSKYVIKYAIVYT